MSESTAQLKRIWPYLLIYMVLGFLPIFILTGDLGTWGIVLVIIFEVIDLVGMLFAVCYKIKDHKWKYLILGDDFKKQIEERKAEFFDNEEARKVQMRVAKDNYRTYGNITLDICVKPMLLYPMPPELIGKDDNSEECQAFLEEAMKRFVTDFRYRFLPYNTIKLFLSADGRERYFVIFFPGDKKYIIMHETIMFMEKPEGHEYYRQGYWFAGPENEKLIMDPSDSLEDLLFKNRFTLLEFEEDQKFVSYYLSREKDEEQTN